MTWHKKISMTDDVIVTQRNLLRGIPPTVKFAFFYDAVLTKENLNWKIFPHTSTT